MTDQHDEQVIKARPAGRVITCDGTIVTIRRSAAAWLLGPKTGGRKHWKHPLPNRVEFHAGGVLRMRWREPGTFTPGCLTIETSTGSGDPWRGSAKERPHRLRFAASKRGNMLAIATMINMAVERWSGTPLTELPQPEQAP